MNEWMTAVPAGLEATVAMWYVWKEAEIALHPDS